MKGPHRGERGANGAVAEDVALGDRRGPHSLSHSHPVVMLRVRLDLVLVDRHTRSTHPQLSCVVEGSALQRPCHQGCCRSTEGEELPSDQLQAARFSSSWASSPAQAEAFEQLGVLLGAAVSASQASLVSVKNC